MKSVVRRLSWMRKQRSEDLLPSATPTTQTTQTEHMSSTQAQTPTADTMPCDDGGSSPLMTTSQQDISHFFRLPRELRDEIYALVVFCDKLATIPRFEAGSLWIDGRGDEHMPNDSGYATKLEHRRLLYRPPPLLSTNRQIRQELGECYYSKTPFLFDEPETCTKWLLSLDTATMQHLRFLRCCICEHISEANSRAILALLQEKDAAERWDGLRDHFEEAGLEIGGVLQICNQEEDEMHAWLSDENFRGIVHEIIEAGSGADWK